MTGIPFVRDETLYLHGINPQRICGHVLNESEYASLWKAVKLGEWIDGFCVEKIGWLIDSFVATTLGVYVEQYGMDRDHGFCTGASGPYRMKSGNVLMPDFAYSAFDRVTRPLPDIADWCPDLCVDVTCPDNTAAEMAFRRSEFFESGCRLVWEIDPHSRIANTYSGRGETHTRVDASGILSGEDALPGFSLPLADLFDELDDYFPRIEK